MSFYRRKWKSKIVNNWPIECGLLTSILWRGPPNSIYKITHRWIHITSMIFLNIYLLINPNSNVRFIYTKTPHVECWFVLKLKKKIVLVCLGCFSKIPQNGYLINSRKLFLTVLKTESPSLRCWYGHILVKALFLDHNWCLLSVLI